MVAQDPTQKPTKSPLPLWVWPFAIACFAIPVMSLGGAIPTGLGVGGGFYCLAVAREANKTTHRKLFHCGAAMAAAWTLFLVMAGGVAVLQNKAPGLFDPGTKEGREERLADSQPVADDGNVVQISERTAPRPIRTASTPDARGSASLDAETRREIYAKAVSLRDDIERAEQREREFTAKGMGEVASKQVEHIKGMHESRQEFTASFYKISRAELDAIVAQGDRERWPRD